MLWSHRALMTTLYFFYSVTPSLRTHNRCFLFQHYPSISIIINSFSSSASADHISSNFIQKIEAPQGHFTFPHEKQIQHTFFLPSNDNGWGGIHPFYKDSTSRYGYDPIAFYSHTYLALFKNLPDQQFLPLNFWNMRNSNINLKTNSLYLTPYLFPNTFLSLSSPV